MHFFVPRLVELSMVFQDNLGILYVRLVFPRSSLLEVRSSKFAPRSSPLKVQSWSKCASPSTRRHAPGSHVRSHSEVPGKDHAVKFEGQSKERVQESVTRTICRSSTVVCLPTLANFRALLASVAPGLTQSLGASAASLGEGNKGHTPDPPQQDPSGPSDPERQGPCPLLSRSGPNRSSRQSTSSQTLGSAQSVCNRACPVRSAAAAQRCACPPVASQCPRCEAPDMASRPSAPTGEVPEGTSPRQK